MESSKEDHRTTKSLQGNISYSSVLERLIFLSDSGDIIIVNIDKEHLDEIVHGESLPVCVDLRY